MGPCCDDALKLDYLNGTLSERDKADVEAHLAACRECRQEIDGLRQTAAALAALTLPSAPAAWTNAAKTRLRARSTAPVAAIPVRPAHARPRTAVLQYSAIAAGAVASLVLLVGLVTGGMVRGGDPHAARAVQLVTWVLSLHALVVVPLIIDDVYLLVRSGSRRRQRLE